MPRSRARLLLVTTALLFTTAAMPFVACLPSYSFDSSMTDGGAEGTLSDGRQGLETGADVTLDSPSDTSNDAGEAGGPPVPVRLADAGGRSGSTGYGYQAHLVYAQNDERYWYFYVDDTTGVIKTLASPDFSTWTPGNDIALGGSYAVADGYSFSVVYANLGGTDVVHVVADAVSSTLATLHIRATIVGGVLTPSAPSVLPDSTAGSGCLNDGPSTTITASGQVFDVTAWAAHDTSCDTDVYLSPGLDTGAGWNSASFTHDGYFVSYPEITCAHELVSLPEAGTAMVLYPDQDPDSNYDFLSVGWALSPSFGDAGVPGSTGVLEDAGAELFTSAGLPSSYDDWSSCRLGGSEVHLVRHVLSAGSQTDDGDFEEVVYVGGSWQTTATPPPSSTSVVATGLVLLSNDDPSNGMLLVTLGIDGALNLARWTSGGGWTTAGKVPGDGNVRQSLAGSGCGSARPTVFWTESIGGANVIESANLSSYL